MIINEIKDIVLDIIMNIENRELSTCPDDINNNSQYTDENEIIILPPNQTSPKAEPEVITISSDEETIQDNFMDANIHANYNRSMKNINCRFTIYHQTKILGIHFI